MIVFSGSRPADITPYLRGINGCFCFYNELTPRQKRRLKRGKPL